MVVEEEEEKEEVEKEKDVPRFIHQPFVVLSSPNLTTYPLSLWLCKLVSQHILPVSGSVKLPHDLFDLSLAL